MPETLKEEEAVGFALVDDKPKAVRPPSPTDTLEFKRPNFGPSDTQPAIPLDQRPGPSDTEMYEMMDRVRSQDEEFLRKVESALQGAMNDLSVKVLDFRWVEGNQFSFIIDVGGHAQEVIVEKRAGGGPELP